MATGWRAREVRLRPQSAGQHVEVVVLESKAVDSVIGLIQVAKVAASNPLPLVVEGEFGPHLIKYFMGPQESLPKTGPRSVEQFLQGAGALQT